jgi:hypothetical protein
MTVVEVSDAFWSDDRVLSLGVDGRVSYFAMLVLCHVDKTNGFVPHSSYTECYATDEIAGRIVRSGLAQHVEGGLQLFGFALGEFMRPADDDAERS